jgi:hypothetical protein
MTDRFPWQIVVLTALAVVCGAAVARSASAVERIGGTWRGSSTCTDRVAAPACNDEQVVYEIVAVSGKPNTVALKADKVIDGKRVPMGVLDFTVDKDGLWTSEFETPRVHAIWRLVPGATTMTGSLTLLPSKAVVRRVELKRDK